MTEGVKEWEQRGLSQNDRESKGEETEEGLSQNDRESKGEGTERVYLRMIESQLGTYIDVNEKMCRG